tara:strand:+ start:3835 stop:4521 length:687 start_codon:yes stop_codon:yes gene_type:complete
MAQWKQIMTAANTVSDLAAPSGSFDLNTNQIINVSDPTSAQHAATKNYVDNAVISDTNFGTTDLSIGSGRSHTLADNVANALEIKDGTDLFMKFVTTTGSEEVEINNLKVSGTLKVTGNTFTTETEVLKVADNTILLNSDLTTSADVDAGIVIERGTSHDNAMLYWDEGDDKWRIGTNDDADIATTHTYGADVMQVRIDGSAIDTNSTEVPIGHMQYHDGALYVRVED